MKEKTPGFIGGGRVARIIPGGLKKAGKMPAKVVASDTNPDVFRKLQSAVSNVETASNNNRESAAQDLIAISTPRKQCPAVETSDLRRLFLVDNKQTSSL
jgi:pyrroline-5-carboxylate reductase